VIPTEPASFEAFYVRHKPLVFTIALRLLLDVSDAEDLTQAVFLKIWQRPQSYRNGSMESWLTCVARNATIDMIRRRRKLDCVALPANVQIANARSLEDEVLSSITAFNLRRAVRDLPEAQRRLVFESFWNGTSHERIAAVTQLPLGTVKTRIRSGITRLRKKVERAVA
jgi:RNA polymerase sigma-70 factor (ECF subfamily)